MVEGGGGESIALTSLVWPESLGFRTTTGIGPTLGTGQKIVATGNLTPRQKV